MTVADFLWRLMRRLYILHLYKLCLFLSKRKRGERFSCTAVEINFKCSFVFQSHELSFFVFCYQDFKNALESEVRLSVREHLEARCVVSTQGAVHWTTCGTAACLIREVWHYVARVGQCLWRLSFYQKVEISPTHMLIVQLSEVLSRKLLFCYSTPPDNVSIQEFQKNEAIDVEVRACF